MRVNHFTRPTVAAAVGVLDASLTQAKFDQVVFRLGLEASIPFDTSLSVSKKAALLAREVAKAHEELVRTADGVVTLAEAVVREAVSTMTPSTHSEGQERLMRALALDGFVIQWSEASRGRAAPSLRAALPDEVDLPETDDEVHQLLNHYGFIESKGHLDQAIEAHTRGDWAAANSQTRTFMESLFDAIARNIDDGPGSEGTSENRRAMLAKREFLSVQRNEWAGDGKGYINGLFKMLHTEGSHPGLSDEDRSTFRLHLALVTARTFLRRLKNGG
ncbi:hypothetical protein M3A49_01195 [Paraburkholderia sp. CNPSo 3076]|uniref:hypothetical protein n=1 Tax=Paraburkholderia sp. CNPSo 3076 TaxID=2940936 RepID=UPI002252C3F3|nr:hypothetical protein [Paraburkholderia sp. CNPSo 3076]MCX5538124.1 hypothetical protein [Paraburkholderia sp. CNPSo 3076]